MDLEILCFCGNFKNIRIFANYYKYDKSQNTYYDVNPVLFWSGLNEVGDTAQNELYDNKPGVHNGPASGSISSKTVGRKYDRYHYTLFENQFPTTESFTISTWL